MSLWILPYLQQDHIPVSEYMMFSHPPEANEQYKDIFNQTGDDR